MIEKPGYTRIGILLTLRSLLFAPTICQFRSPPYHTWGGFVFWFCIMSCSCLPVESRPGSSTFL